MNNEIKSKRKLFFDKIFINIRPLHVLEKIVISKRLYNKYKKFTTNVTYFRYFAGKFVGKKKCHTTTFFKENLLFNTNKEYIKKLIKLEESKKDLNRYTVVYKDYIDYYCFPMITDYFYNDIVLDNKEAKAELFYNVNYRDKESKKESSKDNGIIIYSKRKNTNENESKNELIRSIFNKTLRKKIESDSTDKIECSKVKSEENSQLISSTNENALKKLLNELNNNQKEKNNNINIIKINNSNSSRLLNKTKIEFNSNIEKIRKLNQLYKNVKEKNGNFTKIFSYNDKTFDLHKRKTNNFINSIKFNYAKSKNDKSNLKLFQNKSTMTFNDSLKKSISLNRNTINTIDFRPKLEIQKSKNRKIYSLKNKFSNNLQKKGMLTITPDKSYIIKLNKIIRINNNIININIVKNKEKSFMANRQRNYNYKLFNQKNEQKSAKNLINNKLNNINDIMEIKNLQKVYSRNKHNSKTLKFFSSRKIDYNNKLLKVLPNSSLPNQSKIIYNNNKINKNSILKNDALKLKLKMLNKTNNNPKRIINNENYIKSLNSSSVKNYKRNKYNSGKIISTNKKKNIK